MKLITQILHNYRTELGEDYQAYHNHAHRTYRYAITFSLMRESTKVAIAAAFHDLYIWTGNTMDYVAGSAEMATDYLKNSDIKLLPDEVKFIITSHHKLQPTKGNLEAEAFRKADLTDLTAGFVRYNLPNSIISQTEERFPRNGFTRMILKKTLNRALRHPFNPLPMIKW